MTQILYAHMNKIKIKKKPMPVTDFCSVTSCIVMFKAGCKASSDSKIEELIPCLDGGQG
jgi:hypothetical protein